MIEAVLRTTTNVQRNWTCGSCRAAITELPFEPDPNRLGTLKCRDCHRKAMADRGDSEAETAEDIDDSN